MDRNNNGGQFDFGAVLSARIAICPFVAYPSSSSKDYSVGQCYDLLRVYDGSKCAINIDGPFSWLWLQMNLPMFEGQAPQLFVHRKYCVPLDLGDPPNDNPFQIFRYDLNVTLSQSEVLTKYNANDG